jgi:tetratricopeptide (TPR) repeat protein
VPARNWLIVTTRRSHAEAQLEAADHLTTLELGPLDAAASADLINAASSASRLPEHRIRKLTQQAGGNPLFLTHLLAAAANTADDALPDTIEGVLSAQIDRLPSRRRRWLRAASVLGMSIDPELLHDVLAGTDLADEDWSDLSDFITLTGDRRLQFTNYLVRLSAYEGLPYRRRIELHARTAEILEQRVGTSQDSADVLSLHCLEGAKYDAAWRYARTAGDRARDLFAPAEAAECYRRAISASSRLSELADSDLATVFESLAQTYMDLGEGEAAERALRNARQRAKGDPYRCARLHLATARQRQHSGRHADALRWVSRGRSQLSTRQDPAARSLQARLAECGAQIRYDQGAYKAALVWARRAGDEARAAGDPVTESHALATTAVLSAAAGLPLDESTMRYAMSLYERIEDYRGKARAANMFGMTAYFAGNWDAAVTYYAEAEQASRRIGRDHDAALVAVNRAEVLVQQRRVHEAEPVVVNALRILVGANATSFLGFATTIYARVLLGKQEFGSAMDRLAEARRLCVEMGETDETLTVDALIAETLLRSGAPEDALSYAEVALAQIAELTGEATAEPALHRVVGEALAASGSPRGEESLRRALECARKRGAQNEIEESLEALLRFGVAEGEDESVRWRAEAAELARTLGIVSTLASDTVRFAQTDVVGGPRARPTTPGIK